MSTGDEETVDQQQRDADAHRADVEALPEPLQPDRDRDVAQERHDARSDDAVVHREDHQVLELDVDVLIPAALENQITTANAERIQARLIVEAANGPVSPEADDILAAKGIHVLPDILANAGGVICAAIEYQGGSDSQALAVIDEKITRNTTEVMQASINRSMSPRMTARDMAAARVRDAMSYRRRF